MQVLYGGTMKRRQWEMELKHPVRRRGKEELAQPSSWKDRKREASRELRHWI